MDDSGFYAGEITHCALQQGASFLSWCLEPVLSPGGPVPQVGVTIAMDDELLNGTNRVVLDGVMTEKECEMILHLANVSSERETGGLSGRKKGASRSRTRSSPTGCGICRGWLQRSKVSAHTS